MPINESPREPDVPTTASRPLKRQDIPPPDAQSFRASFGEELAAVLDVESWRTGQDPLREYDRILSEVQEALTQEAEWQRRTRAEVFPKLFSPATAVPNGGVYKANRDILGLIHRGLLFNGGVECCDATVKCHDTLPLTIYQIGVSLVSYRGDQGTWHQRLFRRDLRQQSSYPGDDILELLEQRSQRAALNHGTPSDTLGALAQKTIMDYAERAIILKRSQAVWRMGHGNPITYELVTGAGILELMIAGTGILRELIEGHRKFVFVASEPRERMLLTIGQALEPMQYAIVCTLEDIWSRWIHQFRFKAGVTQKLLWDNEPISPAEWIPRFLKRVASQVIVGVYRASPLAPAHLFYAHADFAHLAAHIVMADSMLQVHRGFPLLIDLADHVCSSVFGGSLDYLTETAYSAVGTPYRYFSERTTRDR